MRIQSAEVLWLSVIGTWLSACTTAAKPAQVVEPEPVAPKSEPAPNPDLEPGLEPEQIQPVVLDKYGAIGGCHALEYAGQADLATGTMTLDWMIQPDGSVTDVIVLESSFDNERVEACVLEVATTLVFPEAPGNTPVSWRFKFRPSGDGKTARVQ